METISFHTVLSADGALPEWLHLVPAGVFKGVDGRGPYRLDDPEAAIAASMTDGKIPVDENHATDLAAPSGGPSPAKGWITSMIYRAPQPQAAEPGGIYGRVEWNEAGKQLIGDKAYRGVSPVMDVDGKGSVKRIRRAALTNTPNLPLKTIHHQQDTGMDLIAELRRALGLPANADEGAALQAVQTNAATLTAQAAQLTELQGQVTTLQATSTEAVTLRGEVTRLTTELHTLQQDKARQAATSFIETAMAAGKPITPALKEHYITRHMADPEGVKKEIDAMVSLNVGGTGDPSLHATHTGRHDADGGDDLSEMEKAICAKLGLDPKKFSAQKAGKLEAALREAREARKGGK